MNNTITREDRISALVAQHVLGYRDVQLGWIRDTEFGVTAFSRWSKDHKRNRRPGYHYMGKQWSTWLQSEYKTECTLKSFASSFSWFAELAAAISEKFDGFTITSYRDRGTSCSIRGHVYVVSEGNIEQRVCMAVCMAALEAAGVCIAGRLDEMEQDENQMLEAEEAAAAEKE